MFFVFKFFLYFFFLKCSDGSRVIRWPPPRAGRPVFFLIFFFPLLIQFSVCLFWLRGVVFSSPGLFLSVGGRVDGFPRVGTPGLGRRESRVSGPRDSAPRESPASRESRARLLLLNPSTLPWARVPRAASRGLVVRGQVGVQLPTRPFCVRVTGAAWANGERKTKNKKENKGRKKKEQGERSKIGCSTGTSREVTHPSTIPAQRRLTSEF